MHIVHLLTRLLRAGSEENTLATCQWQLDAGHRVTLIHGAGADPHWDTHLPQGLGRVILPELVHPARPFLDAAALRRLRQVYRDLKPDVIHTHQSKAGILGRLAARAVPDAVVAHGIHINPFEGVSPLTRSLYVAAERVAARRTDVFFSVSEAVGRAYVDAGITRRGRVHCVRSGMPLSRFASPAIPRDAQTLLQLPQGALHPKVVLMIAAFEKRKRHVAFLESFARIAPDDVRLLLAGQGPEEEQARATVRAHGLEDRVIFCGHRSDPEALFALADLSVLTSVREGLPRVVIQSIAAGCPPLVQDLPGLDEVLDHGRNGWIADPQDMDGTVHQMCAMLRNDPLLHRLRKGARATDLRPWTLDHLGAQTTALYGLPVRSTAPVHRLVA